MTNRVLQFLQYAATEIVKGFGDTYFDIAADGQRARTEGLQRRLRNLRFRMDGSDGIYQSAYDLANKLGRHGPEIDPDRFYILALASFGRQKAMDIASRVCPSIFYEQIGLSADAIEKEAQSPYPYRAVH